MRLSFALNSQIHLESKFNSKKVQNLISVRRVRGEIPFCSSEGFQGKSVANVEKETDSFIYSFTLNSPKIMSNLTQPSDLPVVQNQPAKLTYGFTEEEVTTIRSTVSKDIPESDFLIFLATAKKRDLDPLSKDIYLIPRTVDGVKRGSILVSIDGFRKIAIRSGEYEGRTDIEWCGLDGVWTNVWLKDKSLIHACRVGVRRKGYKEPTYTVCLMSSFRGNSPLWTKMPEQIIAKCTEAQSLRAAFPDFIGGLYTTEEMDQANVIATAPQDNGQLATISQPKKEKPMNIIQQPDGSIIDPASGEQITPPTKVVWDAKNPEFRTEKQHRDMGILLNNAVTYGVTVPNKKGEFKPISLEYINSVEKRLSAEPSKTVYRNFDKLFKEAIERKLSEESENET